MPDEAQRETDFEEDLSQAWQDGEEAPEGARFGGCAVDIVQCGMFDGFGSTFPDGTDGETMDFKRRILAAAF